MPVAVHIPVDWSRIKFYEPSDFKHPEKLEHSVVWGLDRLAFALGKKAIILSDYRLTSKFADSMHLHGRAIDFTYPDLDSMEVLNTIRNTALFSGVAMYVNAAGIVSFHVDTRTDRSPESPATWGAQKGPNETEWVYTTLRSIIDVVGPTALPIGWLFVTLVSVYFLTRK